MTTHPIDLEFLQAWRAVGAGGEAQTCVEALRRAWREPQRHYHSLQHLSECLDLLRAHRDVAERPDELVLALGLGYTAVANGFDDPVLKDRMENLLEWHIGALMTAWYLLLAWVWRREGFALGFSLGR